MRAERSFIGCQSVACMHIIMDGYHPLGSPKIPATVPFNTLLCFIVSLVCCVLLWTWLRNLQSHNRTYRRTQLLKNI